MLKQFAGQGKTIEVKVKNNTLVFLFSTDEILWNIVEPPSFGYKSNLDL